MRCRFYWYDGFFIVLFVYLIVLQIYAIWPFTIDDMYISLRYAKNWASGSGLLWNIAAPPVEGYSNFSFVVLGYLALLLDINPILILKSAGIVGLLGTCLFIFLISRFWFYWREALLPCIALLFYKGQIIWSVSGLETTVYQALICGSVYFIFRGLGYQPVFSEGKDSRQNTHNSYLIWGGIFIALAGLTRPEAPALMMLFVLLLCWDTPKASHRQHWQGVMYFVLAIVFIFCPYFLWRWTYYGFIFPNSVYCKGFIEKSFLLDWKYLKLIWPFMLLSLPACIKAGDKRHYFLWLPSVVYLLMLAHAEPIVAFDNRLFLTAFVLMLPLTLQGINTLIYGYLHKKDGFFVLPLYLAWLFIIVLFIPPMSLAEYRYFSQRPQQGEQLRHTVVRWLNEHGKQGDRVVLGDAGLIPYLSGLSFTDSYCLNNKTMAHYPAKQRYELFCQQILTEKPEIIILTSLIEKGNVIYAPSDSCLKERLKEHKDYKLENTYSTNAPDAQYRYELFVNF